LVKTAAVCGRDFTTETLKHLSPLHRDTRH